MNSHRLVSTKSPKVFVIPRRRRNPGFTSPRDSPLVPSASRSLQSIRVFTRFLLRWAYRRSKRALLISDNRAVAARPGAGRALRIVPCPGRGISSNSLPLFVRLISKRCELLLTLTTKTVLLSISIPSRRPFKRVKYFGIKFTRLVLVNKLVSLFVVPTLA